MSRIQALIERLESGEEVSRADTRRILKLQALDVARMGEEFAEEAMEREDNADAS